MSRFAQALADPKKKAQLARRTQIRFKRLQEWRANHPESKHWHWPKGLHMDLLPGKPKQSISSRAAH